MAQPSCPRVVELEAELVNERRLRTEAEQVLEDVRRECQAPFVVPALLDAFTTLSRLTNDVVRNSTVDN